MVAVGRLHRHLAQQIVAALELPEQLIIQIVTVGQHHQRRVLHRRLADYPRREKQHGETLAAALRVPHHARATVAGFATVHAAGPVMAGVLTRDVRI